jgi:hypothetical protein
MICSASADETLCFWNVFEKVSAKDDDVQQSFHQALCMTPSRRGLLSGNKTKLLTNTPTASLSIR